MQERSCLPPWLATLPLLGGGTRLLWDISRARVGRQAYSMARPEITTTSARTSPPAGRPNAPASFSFSFLVAAASVASRTSFMPGWGSSRVGWGGGGANGTRRSLPRCSATHTAAGGNAGGQAQRSPSSSTCLRKMSDMGSSPLGSRLNRRYMRARSPFCSQQAQQEGMGVRQIRGEAAVQQSLRAGLTRPAPAHTYPPTTPRRTLSSRSSAAQPLCSFSRSCAWCTRSSSFSACPGWGGSVCKRGARSCGGKTGFGRSNPQLSTFAPFSQPKPYPASGPPNSHSGAPQCTNLLQQLGLGGDVEVGVDALLLIPQALLRLHQIVGRRVLLQQARGEAGTKQML